jgi:hypothetical protein
MCVSAVNRILETDYRGGSIGGTDYERSRVGERRGADGCGGRDANADAMAPQTHNG